MAGVVEYPPILTGNQAQDSYNLREYIIRNIEALQKQFVDSGGSVFVENGDVYVTINGGTMTLQQYIEENILMDGAIVNVTVNATINSNPELQAKIITVTENGTQVIEPDEGKDGLSLVNLTVDVPTGEPSGTVQLSITANGTTTEDVSNYESAQITVNVQPVLQSKVVSYTTNGSRTITPDAGKDGLSSVSVSVNVPATQPSLQSKSVSPTSSQQTITPDTGYDGLSQVVVAGAPLQTRTVTPTAAAQQIEKSSSSWYGLQRVNINGDANLVAGNIRSGVSIFGVAGSYSPSFNLQSKNATPSGSAQTIKPDSGYDGLSQVTVAAVALEAKSVTPSASQQVITPTSGKTGLSQVTVAGDADLIAANIKKDVVIFGVVGTYEGSGGGNAANGSLIEITCSSNIDSVIATVNGHNYTASFVGGKAYVTIPYSDTTVARTCTLKGYSNGSQVTSAQVSMAGIGYYTASLSTSAYLYNNGTWYGVTDHSWYNAGSGSDTTISESASTIYITKTDIQYSANISMSPLIDMRGYTNFEVEYSITGAGTVRTGSIYRNVKIGNYAYVTFNLGHAVSHDTVRSTNGTISSTAAQLGFQFTNDTGPVTVYIHSIKFV